MVCNKNNVIKYNINTFPMIIGHPNFTVTKKTAETYGIKLTGTEENFNNCKITKIKVKKN